MKIIQTKTRKGQQLYYLGTQVLWTNNRIDAKTFADDAPVPMALLKGLSLRGYDVEMVNK